MKKSHKIVVSIMSLIFIVLGVMVRNTSEGILFDNIILNLIHKEINPFVFPIMKLISFIGSAYFLIPLMLSIAIYTIYKKKYYILKFLLVSTLGSYIFNFILKYIFNRTRPIDYFLVEQGGLSYPSGHSMVTMTFYMTLAYLLTNTRKYRKSKKNIYIIASILILLMGLSRLYLGVHWPTDIIGGYLIGCVFFIISVNVIQE